MKFKNAIFDLFFPLLYPVDEGDNTESRKKVFLYFENCWLGVNKLSETGLDCSRCF